MADRLYLSYWLRGFTSSNMLRQFEKALARFPFSKLTAAAPALRIYAVSFREPPLEAPLPNPPDPGSLLAPAREFVHADACLQIEAYWDLWSWETDWSLKPSRVLLECFGPEFEDAESGVNLRLEFGLEDQFLVLPGGHGAVMVRANVQSLLRLVHYLDEALPVEKRLLWSESGGNFADRLQSSLREAG